MSLPETLHAWSRTWAVWATATLVDTILVATVIGLIWLAIRRRVSAQLGYCLFLLVLLKLFIPVSIAIPQRCAVWTTHHWCGVAFSRNTSDETQETRPVSSASVSITQEVAELPNNTKYQASSELPAVSPSQMVATRTEPVNRVVAPRPAHRVSPFRAEHVRTALMLLWATCIAALVGRFLWIQVRFAREVRRLATVNTDSLRVDYAELLCRVGLRRTVPVLHGPCVASPAVWGLWRPVILLPDGMCESFEPDQLRWVLLHELAHIRRRDLHVAVLQRMAVMVHFYNPAIWLVNSVIDRLREFACDDAALLLSRAGRIQSSRAFLRVLESATPAPPLYTQALGMSTHRGTARCRLLRLLNARHKVRTRLGLGAMLLLALAAFVLLPTLRADVAPSNDSQQTTNNEPQSEQSAKQPVDLRQKAETQARTFLNLLWGGKIAAAVDMSPEFRRLRFDDRGKLITDIMKGSDGELRQLSENFRRRVGEFQEPISFHSRTMADRRVLEVRCQWEQAVLLNRFLFDDHGRIEGYWLARDPKEPAPESFSSDGYMLGVEMCRVAGRCGTIPVRVVHAEGKSPGLVAATLWTALPKGTERLDNPRLFLERNMAHRIRSHLAGRAKIWTDPQTQRQWIRLAHPVNTGRRLSGVHSTNTPTGTRLVRAIHSPTRVRSVLFENPYAEPNRPKEYQTCFERLLPGEYLVTVCWEDDNTSSSSENGPALTDRFGQRIDAKSPILRLDLSKKPRPITIVVPVSPKT